MGVRRVPALVGWAAAAAAAAALAASGLLLGNWLAPAVEGARQGEAVSAAPVRSPAAAAITAGIVVAAPGAGGAGVAAPAQPVVRAPPPSDVVLDIDSL